MTTAADHVYVSPTLDLVGAVLPPEGNIDAGVPWHFGDPHGEQRRLSQGVAAVDLSHLGVLRVTGPDRLSWLHSLTSQALERLGAGMSTAALILSPHGHVEHELHVVDDGEATWLIVEAAATPKIYQYLDSMRFMLRVELADVTEEFAVVWEPVREVHASFPTWLIAPEYAGTGVTESGTDRGGDASKYIDHRPDFLVGREVIIPRGQLLEYLGTQAPGGISSLAGTWALEAMRVAAGVPRVSADTDHRTLPHELGWIGPAVHLAKGCYRGQEAVARVHNMGRPPRRLVLLHLDGGAEILPEHGDAVLIGEREVGWIGTAARHYELGPIALAVVKRNADTDGPVLVRAADGEMVAASAEAVVSR